MNELVKFDEMHRAIVACESVYEAKEIIDKTEALRVYAKQADLALEDQNRIAEIKARAMRRAGEITREMEKASGTRTDLTSRQAVQRSTKTNQLEEAGISTKQAQRYEAIAAIPSDEFEQHLTDKKEAKKEITSADLIRHSKRIKSEEKIQQLRDEGEQLSLSEHVPGMVYKCIVIDPPWQMQKIERNERPNQASFDYPTMSRDELMDFPVPHIADDDCHLYLWTTHKHMPLALDLAAHWGFNYQCIMTWVKNVGFTPFSWMYSTEHVLFCRKGNLPLLQMGRRVDFAAKVREHSRKPNEFYNLVRECSPGPRIDIFSREKRDGFAQFGNEVEKFGLAA